MRNQLPPTTKVLLPSFLLVLAAACTIDDGDAGTDTDASTSTGVDETGSSTGTAACMLIGPDDVAADLTLPAGCYEVETLLSINGTTLTMEPGVDMTFAPLAGLMVTGTGVLSAVGTLDQPVDLHGQNEDPGAWQGISFTNAASSSNALEGTLVYHSTGVTVSNGSRLRVSASEFLGTDGFALEAADGAELTVASTLFEANTTPLSVGLSTVEGIGADNVFVDNEEQFALVTGQTLASDATWQAIGIPFHLANRIWLDAELRLEPGVTVAMPQDVDIIVEADGKLNAVGTADAPITLTGIQAEDGFWKGIIFNSNSSSNVIEYGIVDYGGSSDWYGGGNASASLFVPESGKLTVRNSTIRYSGRYALLALHGADISGFEGNTIESNDRAMFIGAHHGGDINPDNRFVDNGEQAVRVSRGNNERIDSDQSWGSLEVPWLITTRIFVAADWVVEAGAVVEVAQNVQIVVDEEGSLRSSGTAEQPVIFTGAEALPGFWGGLQFNSTNASNELGNTIVEYAGSDAWEGGADKEAAIYMPSDGVLLLTDTTIRDIDGHGILLSGGAVTCSGVTFEGIANDNVSGTGATGCS